MGLSIMNKYLIFKDYYNLSFFYSKNILNLHILIGSSSLIRYDLNVLINLVFNMLKTKLIKIKNINILSRHLGRISSLEINIINNKNIIYNYKKLKKIKYFNFFIGVDLIDLNKNIKNINIYLGSFFIVNFFEIINLVLSSSIYTEDIFSYLNLEGRFRYTNKIISPVKYIIADYKIINALNIIIKKIYYYNFSIINNYNNILYSFDNLYNFFNNYNLNYKNIVKFYIIDFDKLVKLNYIYNLIYYNGKLINSIFSKIIYNYYNTDIFSKLSVTISLMAIKINYKNFK
jgi:hypothetical protein